MLTEESTEGIVLNMDNYKMCGQNTHEGCTHLYPKTSEYFQVNKSKSDGLDIYCKDCRSFINRISYIEKKMNKTDIENYDLNGYNGLSEIYC